MASVAEAKEVQFDQKSGVLKSILQFCWLLAQPLHCVCVEGCLRRGRRVAGPRKYDAETLRQPQGRRVMWHDILHEQK
jgi:hypothetical protein